MRKNLNVERHGDKVLRVSFRNPKPVKREPSLTQSLKLTTPWVIRLLAVVSIMLLSMFIF